MSHLIETWQPTASLPVADFLRASGFVPEVERHGSIHVDNLTPISIISCLSARPHVDDGLGWTALLVLQASLDHEVWVADHKPRSVLGVTRRPLKRPHWHVPLTVGHIVQLNVWHTHWVEPAADRGMFVAAFVDNLRQLPHDEVEAMFDQKPDLMVLHLGALPGGVLADDLVPEMLGRCEAMLIAGLLRRGEQTGRIRAYHTTDEGMKHVQT